MGKVMEFLDGKKTYLQAIAGGITVALNLAGLISEAAMVSVLAMLGVGMGASLRSAISKGAK